MFIDEALEQVLVGFTLTLAQGVITSNAYFSEAEIKRYLAVRRQFYPSFQEACTDLATYLEDEPRFQPAIPLLKQIARMPVGQFQQGLIKARQAMLSIVHLRHEIDDPKIVRFNMLLSRLFKLTKSIDTKGDDYYMVQYEFKDVLEMAIRLTYVPTQIKTLFRKILKLGGNASDYNFPEDANPGAWFDMPPEQRIAIRDQVKKTKAEQEAAFKIEDSEARVAEYRRTSKALADLQAEAGVNLKIINQEDREDINTLLNREKNKQADGPTAFLIDRFQRRLKRTVERYPDYHQRLTPRELGKLFTLLNRAKTMGTVRRIIQEAVDREILTQAVLEDLDKQIQKTQKNLAVRSGRPLAPLTWEPMDEGTFQAKHDAGEIRFGKAMPPEEQKEILGKVSRAVTDLETLFGKGFAGKHARPLNFYFDTTSDSPFAMASYFGWDDKWRWQPRVAFGADYENLLSHELSHYLEDLLAYRVEKETNPNMPGYQYGDIAHGRGDIFGRTGVALEHSLEMLEHTALFKDNIPEVLDLIKEVLATPDYQRWKDMLGASLDMTMDKALQEAGIDYDHPDYRRYSHARFKSELPPAVLARAEELYIKMMDGDSRKLTYHHSGTEVWARLCEQYVYTKLAEVGISNPWLTQLSYDVEDLPQYVEEETFEKRIKPLMDRLFAKLKERKFIGRKHQC